MNRFPPNDIVSLVGRAPRFDLAESLGPDLRLGELFDADSDPDALAALAQLPLGYATAAGDAALREQVARAHGVAADDVVLTVGGMHALFLLAFTLCAPGDEAVVAAPLFPLARNALQAVGAELHTLALDFDHGWQPDLAAFRALLSPRTRLVSLASPQNPSGVAIALPVLREMLALMHTHAPQARLLLDETYREATYGSDPIVPSACTLDPRVVTVASLSKCHGAPGLRIGWAISRDAALREQLVTAKFNTVVSCSPLDEAVALQVLRRRDGILVERRRRLAENLALTAQWVRDHAAFVDWVRPDAGALCCVRLKPAVFDDAAVERFHAALPALDLRVGDGRWFGEPRRVFRLGFGLPPAPELAIALQRLSAALQQR
ncbi:pyridoxal phosphate-dependent aminotransferase [Aquincola sp. S2]|uniref:Aminotransferase n=1 Tax=Pseudaquabacterium terrae TaxID=2732868 RepID=A0ABX2EG45_9BURK|nr:pyridoxal phosphate-dependent aminotransferase [Aquabacterium terrae]NRF67594.1 pyridoxal phosphate-dependent aminotransferase [Aquabacterium terrae]